MRDASLQLGLEHSQYRGAFWLETGHISAETFHPEKELQVEFTFLFVFFLLGDMVSLCSPGWPRAHYVAQAGQELTV